MDEKLSTLAAPKGGNLLVLDQNPSYQFTRQQRLLKPSEYKYVFDQPCKSGDQYFTVLAKANGQRLARLGLAIAKKRVKQAVARNRIKRLIRESFRHQQPPCMAGLDCVVLAKNGTDQVNNHTLKHSLARHWQQLSHRCKKS
ncbi:ribonuclease P protein component [Candidatus Parabeggiatoa sp. HSG14]|uniref:ribonuclease P protein component n=1 Tax=Candidatus Parabeggiatoa sp. HSG14 TaxID=3055593 RepID=UPI0025A8A157|nr:ribonuclease P protein component [Thiotrichales bacterium HSG14]